MTKPLRIALCEDIASDASAIETYIRAYYGPADAEVFTYAAGEDLLRACEEGRFDIFFLDIYMEGISGIETARCLRERGIGSPLVFTTLSMEHAVDGFALRAVHYIVKPVRQEAVAEALRRCADSISASKQTCVVNADRRNVEIPLDQILYVEVRDKHCVLQTTRERIKTRTAIDHLEWQLPSPPFYRCHRSFIVNFDFVGGVGEDFLMSNGDTVYIRRSDRKRMEEAYVSHLVNRMRSPGG